MFFFRIFEFLKNGPNISKKRQNLAQVGIHFRFWSTTQYKNCRNKAKFQSEACVQNIYRYIFGFLNFWKMAQISPKKFKIWHRKAYIFFSSPLPDTKIVEIRPNISQRRVFKISRHVFSDFWIFQNWSKYPQKTSKFGSGRHTFSFPVRYRIR